MPETSRGSRSQLRNVADAILTAADKNVIMEGFGPFSWDASTAVFVIGGSCYIRDHRSATVQDISGTFTLVSAAGDCVTVALDRETPATADVQGTLSPPIDFTDSTDAVPGGDRPTGGEGLFVVAVRGVDDRLYLRNGMVLEDGATNVYLHGSPLPLRNRVKAAAMVGIPDYTDVLVTPHVTEISEGVVDGTASTLAVGFSYFVGEGRLRVYRNGSLLTPDYEAGDFTSAAIGTYPVFEAAGPRGDYHEVDDGAGVGTVIQFYAGYVPAVGDTITFHLQP